MNVKGNKGEWSEIYALFKLLGEGKVHAGDANLNKLDIFYPIVNIIRQEGKLYEYMPNSDLRIVIVNEDGDEFVRLPMDTFLEQAKQLLCEINAHPKGTFEVANTETFMKSIGCSKLKAPSSDKTDIRIVIHDLRTNMKPELGFSIKSQLGSAATLLNAGQTTNVRFIVEGKDMSDAEIQEINSIKAHLDRMSAITERGYALVFSDIEHTVFKNNLLFLDTYMPAFVAECLQCSNQENGPSAVRSIVQMVARRNPYGFTGEGVLNFYEHKMKTLLLASALGMTAAKEWKGRYDTNGGYLVIRKDGEIVCFHFYNVNDVEDYLFANTFFERASRERHKFGSLYRGEDGNVYLKLNLQIRFNS